MKNRFTPARTGGMGVCSVSFSRSKRKFWFTTPSSPPPPGNGRERLRWISVQATPGGKNGYTMLRIFAVKKETCWGDSELKKEIPSDR